jgi:uncharacterized protein YegP (UPF0339 family)
MVYEYKNHLIIEDKGKWRVRLNAINGFIQIISTNKQSAKKMISKYNASILSDEDFIKDITSKGHELYE